MQASLRTAYHYYDYGTIDCTARLANDDNPQPHHSHLQQHPFENHHHLQVNEEQTAHHLSQQSDNSKQQLHQHHVDHHLVAQQEPSEPSFEQQQQSELLTHSQQVTCYSSSNDQSIGDEQHALGVYNQYHLLDSSNGQINQINHTDGPIESANCSARDGNGENNGALELYHPQPDQEHASIYQTVYYEPLGYANTDQTCNIGEVQVAQQDDISQQQQSISFAATNPTHLLPNPTDPYGTSADRQVPGDGYEYHHYPPTNQTPDNVAYAGTQQQHSEMPLPLTTPATTSNYESCHQLQSDHPPQIYQMLEVSGHRHHQQQHQFAEQLNQGGDEQHGLQPDMQQYLDGKQAYHMTANCYLDSESMGASLGHSSQYESHSSAASTSSSEESSTLGSGMTRDERRAREANIPLTYCEIVNLSIDQFNEQLGKHSLTESQLTLIKDIRRRGKNKVAAQSCRKRKMEQIYELQREVGQLASKRRSLSYECNQLIKEHGNLVQEYDRIYAIIQNRMRQNNTDGASLD